MEAPSARGESVAAAGPRGEAWAWPASPRGARFTMIEAGESGGDLGGFGGGGGLDRGARASIAPWSGSGRPGCGRGGGGGGVRG